MYEEVIIIIHLTLIQIRRYLIKIYLPLWLWRWLRRPDLTLKVLSQNGHLKIQVKFWVFTKVFLPFLLPFFLQLSEESSSPSSSSLSRSSEQASCNWVLMFELIGAVNGSSRFSRADGDSKPTLAWVDSEAIFGLTSRAGMRGLMSTPTRGFTSLSRWSLISSVRIQIL